jgi:hypothetical protein
MWYSRFVPAYNLNDSDVVPDSMSQILGAGTYAKEGLAPELEEMQRKLPNAPNPEDFTLGERIQNLHAQNLNSPYLEGSQARLNDHVSDPMIVRGPVQYSSGKGQTAFNDNAGLSHHFTK